ncbi:MAG: hypothetical protein GVY36_16755 [Verrucomicrobia bacterium]|jgi:type II secretory pathway pseudopilin PulG|nr:hypothetical protein [Verrucomicrobiota bacterium]
MLPLYYKQSRTRSGFSLIEVVLAIGIFLVTVLALVGLLGPTLKSVDDVEKSDEVASVVNTVNAFLQSSPDIAPGGSKFDAIYSAVANDGIATIIVYRWFDDNTTDAGAPPSVQLEIGFADDEGDAIDDEATVNFGNADFSDAAGPIYRVVLSASSVTPEDWLASTTRNSDTGIFSLSESDPAVYAEGYFAMEVRIYAREVDMQAVQSGNLPSAPTPDQLNDEVPVFTYNTAIVR